MVRSLADRTFQLRVELRVRVALLGRRTERGGRRFLNRGEGARLGCGSGARLPREVRVVLVLDVLLVEGVGQNPAQATPFNGLMKRARNWLIFSRKIGPCHTSAKGVVFGSMIYFL